MLSTTESALEFAEALPTRNGRRTELASFLRTRRHELRPECVGLPRGVRRRTAGLRREEVAELAGISVGLYAWLEQGRDVPVSSSTIEAVSNALVLSEGERRHAQRLVQRSSPIKHDALGAELGRMVHAMHATPTLVLDFAWDVALANAAARAVFVPSPHPRASGTARRRRNALDYIFLDPRARRLFVEWDLVAKSVLETFRFRLTPHLENRHVQRLVNDLHAASPEFARYWAQQRVRTHPDGLRTLAHPVLGALHFETTLLTPNESPDFLLLMFAPADRESQVKIEGHSACIRSGSIAPPRCDEPVPSGRGRPFRRDESPLTIMSEPSEFRTP